MTGPRHCTVQPLWEACQPCLFWMTDAICPGISWRFNLYLITLSKQYHPGWDSWGIVIDFGPSGIMCGYFSKSTPRLECSGRNSKSASSSFFIFASNATTLKRPLIPFHTLICLLFIFISSSTPKSLSPLSLSLLLFTFFSFFFFFVRDALKKALLVWFTFY